MKIHQITHLFHPDQLAGASLYTDMARYWRERGHDIRVTTTFSYYPRLQYNPEDRGVAFRDEAFEGIRVRRVGMSLPRRHHGVFRLLPEISYVWQLARYARFADGWTPDVVVTACPMLAQCLAQRWLYRGRSVPRLIVVQDLMVDAALELGILKVPGFGFLLKQIERWALESADVVTTISQQMSDKLGRMKARKEIIPNWIHGSLQERADRVQPERVGRARARLFYSGNLGVKQGLPDFISLFARVGASWELEIRGGGAEASKVVERAGEAANVSVKPLQEEVEYLSSMAQSTACVITQRHGAGANFLPSKVLPALAVGVPVLAVCEADTPLAQEVHAGGFGAVVRPGDAAGLRAVLRRWSTDADEIARCESAARLHARHYGRDRILGLYEQQLRDATMRGRQKSHDGNSRAQ